MNEFISVIRNRDLTDRVVFNAVWFQTLWFACVLGRDVWLPLALLLVALHLLLVKSTVRELRRLAPVILIGVTVDTALSVSGVFDFGDGVVLPLWLMLVWFAFATTLSRSLAYLGKHLWLAAVAGAAAVPFNYWVGSQAGAVALPLGTATTLWILVPVWAALLPLLFWISRRSALTGDYL
ncbi:conserved hypothetical protein [Luminiphilus syltensis NOR5-1B]|uniref:DUF2878 domain-containing protein n=1 Tax=Luminiphilus syltensis NOR5-1B TaxID=565045 RepID=B8KTM1_9GAMM|nr:DUF2878 domain-containing protein [Luminiphilus syltensis]EED35629.1 conserved hypothetical protein [Luminiphilus syltensis NOR5-1B]